METKDKAKAREPRVLWAAGPMPLVLRPAGRTLVAVVDPSTGQTHNEAPNGIIAKFKKAHVSLPTVSRTASGTESIVMEPRTVGRLDFDTVLDELVDNGSFNIDDAERDRIWARITSTTRKHCGYGRIYGTKEMLGKQIVLAPLGKKVRKVA